MKDEIKEMLDYFRKHMSIDDCIRLSKIEDYITNLQEEYERLKEIENFKFSLRKHETKTLPTVTKNYKNEYEDYKSRIDKANEIIDEVLFVGVKNYRSQLEIIQKVINGGD